MKKSFQNGNKLRFLQLIICSIILIIVICIIAFGKLDATTREMLSGLLGALLIFITSTKAKQINTATKHYIDLEDSKENKK